jgi:hypothetical protein
MRSDWRRNSLLLFVYDKHDDEQTRTGCLQLQHTIIVEKERTADYQICRLQYSRVIEQAGKVEGVLRLE